MKLIRNLAALLALTAAAGSFAQPFVLQCKLQSKSYYDGRVVHSMTGTWCEGCNIGISIASGGKVLVLDGAGDKNKLWVNSDKPLVGIERLENYTGKWIIDSREISAKQTKTRAKQDLEWSSLSINRLTGKFSMSYYRPHVDGSAGGFIEEFHLDGDCTSAKPVF